MKEKIQEAAQEFADKVNSIVQEELDKAIEGAFSQFRDAASVTAGRAKGSRKTKAAAAEGEEHPLSVSIYSFVADNPSSSMEDIAKGLGKNSGDLKKHAKKLVVDGWLKTTGRARGTRYTVKK